MHYILTIIDNVAPRHSAGPNLYRLSSSHWPRDVLITIGGGTNFFRGELYGKFNKDRGGIRDLDYAGRTIRMNADHKKRGKIMIRRKTCTGGRWRESAQVNS